MGLKGANDLRPEHINRRISLTKIQNYAELYEFLEDGVLLKKPLPDQYAQAIQDANAESFDK